jgi:hypothetical protein
VGPLVTILAVFAGLLGGIWVGLALGGRVRGRPRRYWALNGAALLVCMVADFVGLVLGWPWLAFGAIGVMGGMFTGLKYGYSESIGLWRALDHVTGVPPLRPDDEPNEPEEHDGPVAE